MGEGGEGAGGRHPSCLPATLGCVLGVITVNVVVDIPAPACQRACMVVLPAGTVVVIVTGRVVVEVTGRGLPVVVTGAVVTGLVLVEVTGRVLLEVVTGAVVTVVIVAVTGPVIVVMGSVPTPATGGRLNRFKASSRLIG